MKKLILAIIMILSATEAHAMFFKGGATSGGGVVLQNLMAEDVLTGLTGEDGSTALTVE